MVFFAPKIVDKMVLFKKIIFCIVVILILSCSNFQNRPRKTINENTWLVHSVSFQEAGFVLKFKYPNNIIVADNIDNCICVGLRTEFYDENQASFEDNTRQWCICVRDPEEFSIDYLISSWKSLCEGKVTEQRDSITIDNVKATRIIFKSVTPEASYRQLIYLKKYSTLFEIMNVNEVTEKDFETFCESIKIEGNRN